MKTDRAIDERLYDWAFELRVLGNEGAHYTGEQVDFVSARDALDLSEAFLEYMYVLTAKFEAFRQRRGRRVSGPEPVTDPPAESFEGVASE
jgi:hypothetical protein